VRNTIMHGCYIDAAHACAYAGIDWDQADQFFYKEHYVWHAKYK